MIPDRDISAHIHARIESAIADKVWAAYCALQIKFKSAREAIEWVQSVARNSR